MPPANLRRRASSLLLAQHAYEGPWGENTRSVLQAKGCGRRRNSADGGFVTPSSFPWITRTFPGANASPSP
jgi:hypothetical protein